MNTSGKCEDRVMAGPRPRVLVYNNRHVALPDVLAAVRLAGRSAQLERNIIRPIHSKG